ncbi:MAG: Homing endonuclease associated repeat [Solirubrobacterales bacterium]|jgi:DNA-directed RNA polymerase specialized sigma24 family protein|nr:Homing endonuclease associated repeat [Solirubrobacterales bacterium]
MAGTFGEAFAAVQGHEFDLAVGYEIPPRPHAPVDEEVARNFAGLDYRPYEGMARMLAWCFRDNEADGQDAVQQTFLEMYEKEPHLYREDPAQWRGRLYKKAEYRLRRERARRGRTRSIQGLLDSEGDAALADASPCLPISFTVDEEARYLPLPRAGEPWTEEQVIAALQRFRDHHGRPPRGFECQRLHRMPPPSVIRRLFGDFNSAILAAGMTPPTLGQRRRRWTAAEAARACRSFRWRNGRWPDSADLGRNPGELPSAKVMIRFFGSTRAADVQPVAEAILTSVEGPRRLGGR